MITCHPTLPLEGIGILEPYVAKTGPAYFKKFSKDEKFDALVDFEWNQLLSIVFKWRDQDDESNIEDMEKAVYSKIKELAKFDDLIWTDDDSLNGNNMIFDGGKQIKELRTELNKVNELLERQKEKMDTQEELLKELKQLLLSHSRVGSLSKNSRGACISLFQIPTGSNGNHNTSNVIVPVIFLLFCIPLPGFLLKLASINIGFAFNSIFLFFHVFGCLEFNSFELQPISSTLNITSPKNISSPILS